MITKSDKSLVPSVLFSGEVFVYTSLYPPFNHEYAKIHQAVSLIALFQLF